MDMALKEAFLERWARYFPGAGLPLTFSFTGTPRGDYREPPSGHTCVVADLTRLARRGGALHFSAESLGCAGAERYLGFDTNLRPGFEHFLSTGIPGKMEGERYKKTPELVKEFIKTNPGMGAPAPYIVFTRWDSLEKGDDPAVVVFFAGADVLSGLFTLANFDEAGPDAVHTPFCAGCGAIVGHPWAAFKTGRPTCYIGLFDVSARPCVAPGSLTFAAPMPKFARMVANMDESFLITDSWDKVRRRMEREGEAQSSPSA